MALSKKTKKAQVMAQKRKTFKSTKITKKSIAERVCKFYQNLSPSSKSKKLEHKRKHMQLVRTLIPPNKKEKILQTERENKRKKYSEMSPKTWKKTQVAKKMAFKKYFNSNPNRVQLLKCDSMNDSTTEFNKNINQTADFCCLVCEKLCFKYQIHQILRNNFNIAILKNYLPDKFYCCNKCNNTFKKKKIPANAFWNNMKVISIPEELKILSEMEIRLLSRITPFLKIIRLQGFCGQFGLKGQAILFAQQVEEVAEQLPLSSEKIKIIIIGESLAQVKKYKEYSVSLANLYSALLWLIKNNRLYATVQINLPTDIEDMSSKLFHLIPSEVSCKVNENKMKFKELDGDILILCGEFHQGSVNFDEHIRGKQCTAIAAAAIVEGHFKNFDIWSPEDINKILLVGSRYYEECLGNVNSGINYLMTSELLPFLRIGQCKYHVIVRNDISVGVTYCPTETQLLSFAYRTLVEGLIHFFTQSNFGILTLKLTAVAVAKQFDRYWLFDSHSRGPKGCAAGSKGKAILMSFPSVETLSHHILKMMKCKKNREQYTISGIQAKRINELLSPIEQIGEINDVDINNIQLQPQQKSLSLGIEENCEMNAGITCTALMPVDTDIPALEDIISNVSNNDKPIPIYHLQRKTAPPINILLEKRAEELAWYYLFPDGRNGLKEDRQVPITPLEYYQTRVMGADKRFQRLDYLFYALSTVELYKAKQNISVCGRLRQNGVQPTALVDNIHISMRNIRGSGSYWHNAYCNLLNMVRNLGPPSWYMTLSCNDLHWPDILQSLLKADDRPNENPENLSFIEKKRLVETYPVTLSRQFMHRFNALMKLLKSDPTILGGRIEDYWWRIEFQLRGSPHVHMVIWCVDLPKFDSKDGIAIINNVVSCSSNTGNKTLDELVKKLQTHKHTKTCFKSKITTNCRFGFPRKISGETLILGPEEAIRNGGRFCVLQRKSEDSMINNYNRKILLLWQANIDLQPCGNALGVAYYISKYVAKSEPIEISKSIAKAINKVRTISNNIGRQLFAVSMAILNHRQVSGSECAFRLCHLRLRDSSRKCVFINTCMPEQRYRMLRIDTGSVFDNIFDKYICRPQNLEEISLGEFAIKYESIKTSINCDDDNEDEIDEEVPAIGRIIILLNRKGKMKTRNKLAVLRTRHFSPATDPENYYYSLLVTHIPFRAEEELLNGFDSCREAFYAKKNLLRPIRAGVDIEQFSNLEIELHDAIRRIAAENVAQELDLVQNEEIFQGDQDILIEVNENDIHNDDLEELQGQGMADEYYNYAVKCLNIHQKKLFVLVSNIATCKENNYQLLLFITGGAGSGKTFTLKLLVEQISRCSYTPNAAIKPVIIAAPTGVAAKLIGGNTLHSTFILPIEKSTYPELRPLTGERLERERLKWKYINWVIIDEISMVSYTVLRMIHLRLQQLKQNNLLYGGVHILLFGDLMQLPPVSNATSMPYCFHQPAKYIGEPHLWKCFNFHELITNMRQEDDTTFIDLLNNLRVGKLTMQQLEILDNRRLPITDTFDDAIRVFPTTKQVNEFNQKMAKKSSHNLYLVNAIDKSVEINTYGQTPPVICIPSDPNKTAGMIASIEISINSRVMLRRNIDIQKGLVNGAMGTIKSIQWPALRRNQLEPGELPQSIMIKFDDIKEEVEIKPLVTTYDGLKGYGKIERQMLPIILCWAVTVHKLQGVTLNKAVIDLGPKLFAKGQAYVALSRVKSLEGLIISNISAPRLLNKPHDMHSYNELMRLRNLQIE